MVTEEIINKREALFIHLYETAFPKVAGFIHKMGGSPEDAKDIFHDALLIHYERTRSTSLSPETSDSQYLFGICRHLWYKKFRQNTQTKALDPKMDLLPTEETPKISEQLLKFVAVSGKKCLDLLSAFYYEGLNMTDLSARFGFSGERSATAQKFKCLEKVRTAMRKRSLGKEDFYE